MKVYLITHRMYGSGGEILINVMIYSTRKRADEATDVLAKNSMGTYFVTEFEVIE